MTFGGWSAPSEEEMAANSDFDTLPEDEYIAVVRSIEVKKDQPNRFPSKNDNNPTHDMLAVKADALTFANGDTLVDDQEKPIEGVVPFQVWLNPKKVGMLPQPSNTRKFFAAVLGQALGAPIKVNDFNDLIGKKFIVSLKPNKGYNNAKDYRPIARTRSRATTPKGPIDGAELRKRAEEIFDEDSPTNTSPIASAIGTEDLDF